MLVPVWASLLTLKTDRSRHLLHELAMDDELVARERARPRKVADEYFDALPKVKEANGSWYSLKDGGFGGRLPFQLAGSFTLHRTEDWLRRGVRVRSFSVGPGYKLVMNALECYKGPDVGDGVFVTNRATINSTFDPVTNADGLEVERVDNITFKCLGAGVDKHFIDVTVTYEDGETRSAEAVAAECSLYLGPSRCAGFKMELAPGSELLVYRGEKLVAELTDRDSGAHALDPRLELAPIGHQSVMVVLRKGQVRSFVLYNYQFIALAFGDGAE